jgi:glycosyltransferase involved in cell wall biosynthesis
LKVGLLTSWLSRRGGGVPEVIKPLARSLGAQGCKVHAFGLAEPLATNLGSWQGITFSAAVPVRPFAFGFAPSLLRMLESAELDLLHAHGLWMYPSFASLRWSRRQRRPCVVSSHGMLDPWAVRNAAWKKRLVGWWFEDAHLTEAACLHALNEAEARAIRAYGLRNPICVIPSGIKLPTDEAPAPPAWAKELSHSRKILLFLGRLHPKKGLANLLRALAAVQRDGSTITREWTLVVAGWNQGGHEQELKRLADDLGVAETVRFVGPQFDRDKAASYGIADAFVLPSLSEGLPVAALEAWSYGLPVLMTEACNLPDGFAAGAALRIEASPAGIEEGLRSLFARSASERRAIGARGRMLVAKRFAWPQIAAEMRSAYEWVLGGGPKPSCVLSD